MTSCSSERHRLADAYVVFTTNQIKSAKDNNGDYSERTYMLLSSPAPQQPDLFTAATAPDATQKRGQIKVGTHGNALGACRTLTDKGDAGKALTAREEEKLLSVEKALGQQMAFDMESVKGTIQATEKESLTVPRPSLARTAGT